ncbi:hypothetical protein ACXR2U_14315 [Jatrophihabitans sp. YIM 134969]
MTLTAPSPVSLPFGWPVVGWQTDPASEPRQLTHAVWPGHRVALCGLVTEVTGGAWPTAGERWPFPRMRCARCAVAVERETATD